MPHSLKAYLLAPVFLILASALAGAQNQSQVWNPDKGKEYVNPIIDADYSDPDICRVGDDYYMTSSSFNCLPGLQILHSTDLVNWKIIGAALTDYPGPEFPDDDWSSAPQHGCGVWAPAIRYHNGEFYIYCGDPDRGIFMVKTKDPAGRWDPPVWVVKAKGYIDPCPLWDEDGKAYLSHGCAGSRAGLKSVLFMSEMTPDGTKVISDARIIYDGHETQPTIEGTKLYKHEGRYYIFSPAGGVPTGWQTVLRSDSPWGPYEEKVVMAQGKSPVNGPHQGGWVDTPSGEYWFVHFQDKEAYGRVVHLQPMEWKDGWPVIGVDKDGDGVGEPVMRYRKPDLPSSGVFQPAESDEFTSLSLGLQWQWHGVPSPYWSYTDASGEGSLRLYSVQQSQQWKNLSDTPNLLLQKFPTESFTATVKLSFVPNPQLKQKGENCGLVVMGQDYAALRIVDSAEGRYLEMVTCQNALKGTDEVKCATVPLSSVPLPMPYSNRYMSVTVPKVAPLEYASTEVYLRVSVKPVERKGNVADAVCIFSYSLDGRKWQPIGEEFTARPGKWIGAKVGLFCNRHHSKNDSGWMEAEWFRITE